MNKFITFEGIDGCGKTTQIELLSDYFKRNKIKNKIIREPGGTRISEKIRDILLNKDNDISSESEALLFLAARSDLVDKIIVPEIKKKNFILCDRYTDSTLAYQGFGRGLNLNVVSKMNLFAAKNVLPQVTIIFDIDPLIAQKRINLNNIDRMEMSGLKFKNVVRNAYLEIAKLHPERCHVIDCKEKDIMEIHKKVLEIIHLHFLEK